MNARLIGSFAGDFDESVQLSAIRIEHRQADGDEQCGRGSRGRAIADRQSRPPRTNPLERHYRDVLCGRVHTPQDDATRIGVGRLALGPNTFEPKRERSCRSSSSDSSATIIRPRPSYGRPDSHPTHIETVAKAHENAGFDRALLAFHSTTPDGSDRPARTRRHRQAQCPDRAAAGLHRADAAGAPVATLDQFSRGRVALHVITGGNATELRQDGNTLDDKDERYIRTSEFLDIFAPNGPAKSRSPTRANTTRSRMASRR